MQQISSISEFLLQAGTDFRVFDMGRAIRPIDAQQFLDMENQQQQPQYPRLQHAWFGLVFWNKQLSQQHYIWFIKLPLDEQGMLIAAARNHFLQIIVDALGQHLEQTEAKGGQLPENPYTFTPAQHQLADFNSISRQMLGLAPSQYYQTAVSYLQSPQSLDWQQVPLQGLADVAARINEDDINQLLQKQLASLAPEVRQALFTSFENQQLPATIEQHLLTELHRHTPTLADGLALARALSQSASRDHQQQIFDTLLEHFAAQADALVVLGGRLWHLLVEEHNCRRYFDAVAALDASADIFIPVFSDLVQVPACRGPLLGMLRWTDKSPALTEAVGKLFAAQGGQ